MQGFHRLFDGRLVIPAVDLVQVHIIHLQALEGFVNRVENVLARESAVVHLTAHLAEYFCGDDNTFPLHAKLFEQPACDAFALAK